jgi:glyoxylase-like metal-dependent hydrolase (beta-lactamase superfamily II)
MTEPKEIAGAAQEVLPGLYHWRIHNGNIGGGVSSSHAVMDEDECAFIDPVRLAPEALAELRPPSVILLTARCHQRAAWRYRDAFDADVWLPHDASPADEEPDCTYADGDELPCGLVAVRTPGPELPHYSFLWDRGPGVVFCSDLLLRDDAGALHFVPPQFHEDPEETRRSVEKLLDLPFGVLCLDHGAPLTKDPKAALRALLESTA